MTSVYLFKHKTAYEMRISDGSSDVCSSDLAAPWKARLSARRAARSSALSTRMTRAASGIATNMATAITSIRTVAAVTIDQPSGHPPKMRRVTVFRSRRGPVNLSLEERFFCLALSMILRRAALRQARVALTRSEEHTSETSAPKRRKHG